MPTTIPQSDQRRISEAVLAHEDEAGSIIPLQPLADRAAGWFVRLTSFSAGTWSWERVLPDPSWAARSTPATGGLALPIQYDGQPGQASAWPNMVTRLYPGGRDVGGNRVYKFDAPITQIAVTLAEDGTPPPTDREGDASNPATYVYTATTTWLAVAGTNLSPKMNRPNGRTQVGARGLGWFDYDGTFNLEWVDEVPHTGQCAGSGS